MKKRHAIIASVLALLPLLAHAQEETTYQRLYRMSHPDGQVDSNKSAKQEPKPEGTNNDTKITTSTMFCVYMLDGHSSLINGKEGKPFVLDSTYLAT